MTSDPLPERVRRQLALARRNRRMRRLQLSVTLGIGLPTLVVGTQMLQAGDGPLLAGLLLALAGLALAMFGADIHRTAWLYPGRAACPRCGQDWEIDLDRRTSVGMPPAEGGPCRGCELPTQDDALDAWLRADAERRPPR